jgi:hypothetical protein
MNNQQNNQLLLEKNIYFYNIRHLVSFSFRLQESSLPLDPWCPCALNDGAGQAVCSDGQTLRSPALQPKKIYNIEASPKSLVSKMCLCGL